MRSVRHDRKKCLRCRYSSQLTSRIHSDTTIYCNYSGKSIPQENCLYLENGEVKDRRGYDKRNCKLYEQRTK